MSCSNKVPNIKTECREIPKLITEFTAIFLWTDNENKTAEFQDGDKKYTISTHGIEDKLKTLKYGDMVKFKI